MSVKHRRLDIDWWIVRKRPIYVASALLCGVLLAGACGAYLWFHPTGAGDAAAAAKASEPTGALFVSFDGEVRVVRAQTRESVPARSNLALQPGDIVQTQSDGRARILLIDGSSLIVRPNSVVQIRDNTASDGGREKRVRVTVDRGQINLRTEEQGAGTTNVVETKLTQNRIAGQTGASFSVREDNSEDIRVATGAVETTTRDGERKALHGGEFAAITQSGRIARVERLMEAPLPVSPRDLQRVFVGDDGTAGVSLRWQRPNSLAPAHYRVEVATSPFFVPGGVVTERDKLATTDFGVRDLRPGAYFWRVCAVAASGQTSEWCDGQKFVVARPSAAVQEIGVSGMNAELVAGGVYLVRGRSQPGNTVHVAGRETIVGGDGAFKLQINVERTRAETDVEVETQQGNRKIFRLALTRVSGV